MVDAVKADKPWSAAKVVPPAAMAENNPAVAVVRFVEAFSTTILKILYRDESTTIGVSVLPVFMSTPIALPISPNLGSTEPSVALAAAAVVSSIKVRANEVRVAKATVLAPVPYTSWLAAIGDSAAMAARKALKA